MESNILLAVNEKSHFYLNMSGNLKIKFSGNARSEKSKALLP